MKKSASVYASIRTASNFKSKRTNEMRKNVEEKCKKENSFGIERARRIRRQFRTSSVAVAAAATATAADEKNV